MEEKLFGEFLGLKMYESEITVIELSWSADVSPATIYKMLKGEWEKQLPERSLGNARRASATLSRLLKVLGEDPRPWLESLGLPQTKRFRKVALKLLENKRSES